MRFIHVWLWPALPAVFSLAFRDIRACTPLAQVPTKGLAVITFVGVEFKHPALCTNPQLLHGRFGNDNVVSVTFKCHVGERQPIPLCQEGDIGTIPVVLAVVAGTWVTAPENHPNYRATSQADLLGRAGRGRVASSA